MATQQKIIPGSLVIRQTGGVAGVDEISLLHDGTDGLLTSQSGLLTLGNATRSLSLSSSALTPDSAGVLDLGSAGLYFATAFVDNITSSGALTLSSTGVVVGAATGGAQGSGSLNAEALFINGVPVAAGVGELDDLTDVTITTPATGHILYYNGTVFVNAAPGVSSGVQEYSGLLTYIASITPAVGTFLVGDGGNFSPESGNTARTSLGLGDADDVTHNSLTLTDKLTTGTIERGTAGAVSLFADAGANSITIGGSTSTLIVAGNLQVDGTTTTVNSTELVVADQNITVNSGGTDATSAGAGINIEGDSQAIVGYFRISTTDTSLLEFKATDGSILTLNIQDDVEIEIANPSVNDILQFNGNKFTNVPLVLDKALDDLTDVVITTVTSGDILYFNGTNWVNEEPGSTSGVQAHNAKLDDIAAISPAVGTFLVGDGTTFVAETGNVARTSLGLGDTNNVTHNSLTLAQAGNSSKTVLNAAYAQTTNDTITELLIGGTDRFVLPNDSTWLFDIKVVARRTDADGEGAAYTFKGAIDRGANAATTALIGDVEQSANEDTAAWNVQVDADNTNGSLRIRATGETSKTIKWVAFVNYVEVIG
jgi:hypothetical protein